MDLEHFFDTNRIAEEFTPYVNVSEKADAITVYFKGDADYSERLNECITVFRSLETDEIVGCRIKGLGGAK